MWPDRILHQYPKKSIVNFFKYTFHTVLWLMCNLVCQSLKQIKAPCQTQSTTEFSWHDDYLRNNSFILQNSYHSQRLCRNERRNKHICTWKYHCTEIEMYFRTDHIFVLRIAMSVSDCKEAVCNLSPLVHSLTIAVPNCPALTTAHTAVHAVQ